MRAIRRLSINFGLVNVPVKVGSMVESSKTTFHQYHDGCGGQIRLPKVCEKCGEKLSPQQIVSGTEVGDKLVVVTAEELKELEEEQNGIAVLEFVPAGEIEPELFDTPYLLEPETTKAEKGYEMLRRTLADSDRSAVVQFTLKTRCRLGVLRVNGNVLVAQTLRWPDEIRSTGTVKVNPTVKLTAQELSTAAKMVDAYSAETFDPSKYHDLYAQRKEELVQSKAAGAEFTPAKAVELDKDADVDDLLAKMEASIAAKKKAA